MALHDARRDFLANYPKALKAGNAAIFAGAGLSQAAGFVNWRELLREIAQSIGLDVDQEHDLIAVAQYHVNQLGGRGMINQHLVELFTAHSTMTENHRILARLPLGTYWTTNYDRLLESAVEAAGRRADVKTTSESMATTRPNADAVVYKMHGDISAPEKAVLTKDDYERYNVYRQLFSTTLQGDLVSKTFLFVGFSFDDPNLEYILSRIRVLLGENQRPHYCILRRPRRSDFERAGRTAEEVNRALAYAETKQEHRIADLRRFAIHAVLIDEYSEITDLLLRVEARYLRQKVMISGSAVTFAPQSHDEGRRFVQHLGRRLAESFQIVSGFGVEIGTCVLNGVLEYLDATGDHRLDNHIVLRPFPQSAPDPTSLKQRWTKYRESMIPLAGIALFLYGNRNEGTQIVPAEGVREEFEIAVAHGLKVVPVGATEYVARELWNKVMGDFGTYYPDMPHLKARFEALGKSGSPENELVDEIIDLLKVIRDA